MKGKYFVLLSSILASTTLASIGFATWIIAVDSTQSVDGNKIYVDDISDKRIGIEYEWEKGDGSVIFGFKTDASISSPWLTNSNSITQEKLSNTLNITIENADSLREGNALDIEFTVNDNSDGGWAKAVAANYVVAPSFPISVDKSAITSSSGTYALTFDFAWGSAFDSKNPYSYFNSKEYSEDNVNEAKEKIGNLKSYTEGVTFKLTISAYAA